MGVIKILLAMTLVICLLPMPYGYYTLIRFVSMGVFAYFAYNYYDKAQKATPLVFIFCLLAILFQPFIKIALGRVIWNIVDVVVAIFLVGLYAIEKHLKTK